MIKLKDIALESIGKSYIKEGGKLFGLKSRRVTTDEMNLIFQELKGKFLGLFSKMELSRSLKSKPDHGDIDIVLLIDSHINLVNEMKRVLGDSLVEFSKNRNIYSVLYRSSIGKDVHVDFLVTTAEEDFYPQWEYLSFNDFSGILGVFSRKCNFNYGTKGFFKIYIDDNNRYHYVHITNDLKKGLKILGYGDIIENYDKIETVDDIVKFISYSPLFSSEYYVGQDMNHSDRKRVRSGRPTADYIRKSLISLNKKRTIEDNDFFFKKLFPDDYNKYLDEVKKINTITVVKSKYNGQWIMDKFPEIKPGKFIGKIMLFWKERFGDSLNSVEEDVLESETRNFIQKSISNKDM